MLVHLALLEAVYWEGNILKVPINATPLPTTEIVKRTYPMGLAAPEWETVIPRSLKALSQNV